jgi:isoleucyl-tRNA synthetase
VLTRLNLLLTECDKAYDDYEPTVAARAIQEFVVEDLSNWYVRLNRRRFWKGDQGDDKKAAFHTLYRCLEVVAMLSAPIAPFYSDQLYRDLTGKSVHLSNWPQIGATVHEGEMVSAMRMAQVITSLALSIRKKEGHRVRQPLQKLIIPVTSEATRAQIEKVRDLILSEVNVKELVILDASESKLTKKIKPDFKKLGARLGKLMKSVAGVVNGFSQAQIAELEANGSLKLTVEGQEVELLRDDVEISAETVPGLSVASDGALTVALDITMNDALLQEGLARELVSRVQTLRKESGFDVTDRVELHVQRNGNALFEAAIRGHAHHILAETLALTTEDQIIVDHLQPGAEGVHEVALDERTSCLLRLVRSGQ